MNTYRRCCLVTGVDQRQIDPRGVTGRGKGFQKERKYRKCRHIGVCKARIGERLDYGHPKQALSFTPFTDLGTRAQDLTAARLVETASGVC